MNKGGGRGIPRTWGGRSQPIQLRGRTVQSNEQETTNSLSSSSDDYISQEEDTDTMINDETIDRIVDAVRVQVQQQINTNMGEVRTDYRSIMDRVNNPREPEMSPETIREAVRTSQINAGMRGSYAPTPFSGNPGEDPLEFLRKFKIYASEVYGDDKDKWKAFFPAVLTGRASNWYVLHSVENEDVWADVETKFEQAFDSIPPEDRYRLVNKRMDPGDTIDSFVKGFMSRMARCKIPSADLVGHFMRALPETYSEKMARKIPDSFMKAVEEAKRLERKMVMQRADAIMAAGGSNREWERRFEELSNKLKVTAIERREVCNVKTACHYCGYANHMIRDCRFKRQDEEKGIYARTSAQAREEMAKGLTRIGGNTTPVGRQTWDRACFLCQGPHLLKNCPENPRSAGRRGRVQQIDSSGQPPYSSPQRGTLIDGVWYPAQSSHTVQNVQISDHAHSF